MAAATAKVDLFLDYLRPHWRPLRAASWQYAATAEDANDLMQDTLLRAWRNFSSTDERTHCRAWILVIMRNVALEWHRTASRRIKFVPTTEAELTELAPADPAESFSTLPTMDEKHFREFLDERLVSALDALEPSFREVIILSVAGGLNYREISQMLDCPLGTVMSRMARARRLLRQQLSEFTLPRLKQEARS